MTALIHRSLRTLQAFGLNLKGVEEKTTAKCEVKGRYREPDTQGPQADKLLSAAGGDGDGTGIEETQAKV